jgi:hypothetical protein
VARDGVAGFESRELVASWFTGFRSWQVADPENPVLESVSHSFAWRDGVNESSCDTNRRRLTCRIEAGVPFRDRTHDHGMRCYERDDCDGVRLDCGCGFWAYATTTQWYGGGQGPRSPGRDRGVVLGMIHGFGRMVIGTKGFRAERAVIAGLVMPPVFGAWSPYAYIMPRASRADARRQEAQYAAVARTVGAALRAQLSSVPFFSSVGEMLEKVPLTPLAPLLDEEVA